MMDRTRDRPADIRPIAGYSAVTFLDASTRAFLPDNFPRACGSASVLTLLLGRERTASRCGVDHDRPDSARALQGSRSGLQPVLIPPGEVGAQPGTGCVTAPHAARLLLCRVRREVARIE